MQPEQRLACFTLFNEIGIINQLTRVLFEASLPPGIQISHFSVINNLVRVGDGTTPLKLARAFQVAKTTMTHTLSGLEKRGYISLQPNPRDGRSKCVFLTDAGLEFRNKAIAALDPDISAFAEVFPVDLIAETTEVLSRIRKYLDTSRDI